MQAITFLRHGEYKQSGELSDKGIAQAEKRAASLKDLDTFDLIIISSALRTKQTAEIITKALNINIPSVVLPELHSPGDDKNKQSVKKLLKDLGSAPLSEYIKHDKDKAWDQYAKGAYDALLACISARKAEKVLVIGHGNIINSLGLIINPEAKDLQDIYFGYCEGFTIFEKDNNLRYHR